MELETVGRVSVGDLTLKVRGQVDNSNGAKGALLGTDTTADAQSLGDEGESGFRSDLDTELSGTYDLLRSSQPGKPYNTLKRDGGAICTGQDFLHS